MQHLSELPLASAQQHYSYLHNTRLLLFDNKFITKDLGNNTALALLESFHNSVTLSYIKFSHLIPDFSTRTRGFQPKETFFKIKLQSEN